MPVPSDDFVKAAYPRFTLHPYDNSLPRSKPSQNDDVVAVEELLETLDEATASLVRPALAPAARERGGAGGATPLVVREFLTRELPRRWGAW